MRADQVARYRPTSRAEWADQIWRVVQPVAAPLVKRRVHRIDLPPDVFAQATLLYAAQGGGAPVQRTLTLLQVSELGIMLKSSFPLPIDLQAALQITLENCTLQLSGCVRHCTQSLGGYKIGFEIAFPPEDSIKLFD